MTEHAQQIPYLWLEEEAQDTKLKKVTNNRKGPLCLGSESFAKKERAGSHPTHHTTLLHPAPPLHHAHKRNSLNRFPVKIPQRPMELVERELGTMSCAQLKDSVEVLQLPCIHMAISSWGQGQVDSRC